jgi:hypothetical protein
MGPIFDIAVRIGDWEEVGVRIRAQLLLGKIPSSKKGCTGGETRKDRKELLHKGRPPLANRGQAVDSEEWRSCGRETPDWRAGRMIQRQCPPSNT